MFVKCRRCNTCIDAPTSHTKVCKICIKHNADECTKKYNSKHRAQLLLTNCKVCFKKYKSRYGKLFCSNDCRQLSHNLPNNIKRRELSIINKVKELKEIKERYAHLL